MTPFGRQPGVAILLLVAFGAGPTTARMPPTQQAEDSQQQGGSGCDEAIYHRLDFWVGEWEVRAGGEAVGQNRIDKVLGGCALVEHWRSAGGGEGRSLFYVVPAEGIWKQVWVTSEPARPGGVKEKELLPRYGGPGVRFQGRVPLPDGGSYLDRTTLTPVDSGRVRQRIETSSDGGASWKLRFDGVYVRMGRTGP